MTKLVRPASRLLSLLAIAVVVACTKAPEPMPDSVPQAWIAAFNARKAQELVALYTNDCVVLPPDAPAVKGRQAVMDFFVPLMKQGITIELSNEESERQGNLAVRRGTYVLKDRHGGAMERGKYLEIWRKQEKGAWLLSRDIWNTDERPQITPPAKI